MFTRHFVICVPCSLREEGGYEFKKTILDVMFDIINKIADATNEGLLMLCEFIEDCEFGALSVRVLHLLADKGPTMPQPGSFIRFIYNRIILEAATIRAAAVTALAKFAAAVPSLRASIITLLRRCLEDDDDEVRDRATLHVKNLEALRAIGECVCVMRTPAHRLLHVAELWSMEQCVALHGSGCCAL